MNINLVDNSETGHHKIYQDTLCNIKNTKKNNFITDFSSIKKNPFKAFKERRNFIKKASYSENEIVHFLYLDSIYKCPFISNFINNRKNKYIGTLHWIPSDKLNKNLLKKISKKLEYIIVHSEYLKFKLLENGINNVICIDYPSFITNRYVEKNNNKMIMISCVGGTRNDKGLDILIDSFKYIDDEVKEKIIFNICGKEQDIKYKDIQNEADKYNINIILKNKFLSDEEYENEIKKSDVILLPYKKIFTGNSGPMTDGIYMNKFILGPNDGNLGYLINKYDLGLIFKQEDSKNLADKISNLVDINLKKNHKYAEELSVDKFIEKHKIIYTDIEEKMNKK